MRAKSLNLFEVLLTPVVPVVLGIYFLASFTEIKSVTIVLLIIIAFFLFKLVSYLKKKNEIVYNISIVSVDWFLLDLLNLLSSNEFTYLKPSILETLIKGSVHLVV